MTFTHMFPNNSATPFQVAVGITVMTNDAFFALAPPDPLGDESQAWYYWSLRETLRPLAGIGPFNTHWEADIRSRRALRGGFKLIYVIETDAAGNTADTILVTTMRLLWEVKT